MSNRTIDKLNLLTFFAFYEAFLQADDDVLAAVAGVDTDTLQQIKEKTISDSDEFYMEVPDCVVQVCDVISVAMMVSSMALHQLDGVEQGKLLLDTEQRSEKSIVEPLLSGDIKSMRTAIYDLAKAYEIDVAF